MQKDEKSLSSETGWIRSVRLEPPSLLDNTADGDRLIYALRKTLKTDALEIDLAVLKKLPRLLRDCGYAARCILCRDKDRWTLIGLAHPFRDQPVTGLAVDLGTSRVEMRLVDLEGGGVLADAAFDNPQLALGPDILARIHYCEQSGGLQELNRLIIDALNRHIECICRSAHVEIDDLYLISFSGNTCMTHLFMGLSPRWIIREPYIPVINRPGIENAARFGLQANPAARIMIFPNIGSYFGGDLISGIFYSGMHRREETAILVDVGTNAEVVLGNANWLIGCAGAAGPALEGGVTKMGMMAGPGVIDQIRIDLETREFRIHTIDNKTPVGICGTGLIDLAANMFSAGMLDIRGKFLPEQCGTRLEGGSCGGFFEIVSASQSGTGRALTISQADIDSLIRSKAAMYTILETITAAVNISLNELSSFYVAGTFGTYIDPISAVTIGMVPDLPLEAYKSLDNSSLQGAVRVLTSSDSPKEIDKIRDTITYLELNVNQDFMNRFSAAKFIPHTNRSLFPSVKIKNR